jgi:predicted nucleic acid-binding protein
VITEFGRVLLQKLGLPARDVRAAVEELGARPTVSVDAALISEAIGLTTTASISYWDALIVRAAARAGCTELLTEDLQHDQRFGELRIVNPFRDLSGA